MTCICDSYSIDEQAPFANTNDIQNAIEESVCKKCFWVVPQGTLPENFRDYFNGIPSPCCETFHVYVEDDDLLYFSKDRGASWFPLNDPRPIATPELHKIVLEDRTTFGTNYTGTQTYATWNTRVLNTEVFDTGNLCTLSGNQFTLQPGKYIIKAEMINSQTSTLVMRIKRVTGFGITVAKSVPGFSVVIPATTTTSAVYRHRVLGYQDINVARTYEIQFFHNDTTPVVGGTGFTINFAPFNADPTFTPYDLYTRVVIDYLGPNT